MSGDRPVADPTAAARELLAEELPYTLAEVAARSGVPEEDLVAVFEPLGRMDRDAFGERDLRYAEVLAVLREHLPLDALVRSARVRRRAVASVVTGDLATVREHLLGPLLESEDRDQRVADLLAGVAAAMVPLEAQLLALDYRHTLEHLLATDAVTRAALTAGNEVHAAIGFVDLVGFTKLSAAATPRELGDALAQFEDLVHAAVSRASCTWAVKLIGDAAMLFSEELDDLVEVMLTIVDEDGPVPDLPRRGGIASGAVLVRDGDYFGPPVNLAARLTAAANPWTVLVDEALADELDELLDVKRIPPVKLRGIGGRRPVRVRRPELTEG